MFRHTLTTTTCAILCGLVFIAGTGVAAPLADDAPFPAGESSQELEGLRCSIIMPPQFDAAKERSLILILHGAGGTETGMARSLAFLAPDDYVIVAPKSKGQVWEKDDLDRVRRITADLVTRLRVGPGRLHGVGFSNGGWNLGSIVFDEDLRFASACWVAAGYNGGKVPKSAKKEMGALALVGGEDPNRGAAEGTPKLLADKVRSALVRVQPGLGHKWPRELMPFYGWWVGVQEGRFTPGVTEAFDWDAADTDPPPAADDGKSGSFVYWYSPADADSENAKALQNAVMLDAAAQYFGAQLRAVRREREGNEEAFAAAKLKETPAIVVYDAKGRLKKALQGKIKAKSLASALRSVARSRKLPR